MEDLDVYIIGDPDYKEPLSSQLNVEFLKRELSTHFDLKFHHYSTEEEYNKFAKESENVCGLVIIYERLVSTTQIRRILKSSGNTNPSYPELMEEWNRAQTSSVVTVFNTLLPLVGQNQVYCAFLTDIDFNASGLRNLFVEFLQSNNLSTDNLHPTILRANGCNGRQNNIGIFMDVSDGFLNLIGLCYKHLSFGDTNPIELVKKIRVDDTRELKEDTSLVVPEEF